MANADIREQQNKQGAASAAESDLAETRTNRRVMAEVASATAVFISVVFVGFEVRESARQTSGLIFPCSHS